MSTSVSDPVTLKDRSDILDILRGFALLGVLLDNLFAFTGWGFITQTQKEAIPTWQADAVVGMLEQVFVNGKFYSIFSILFGVGFSIILIRNEQKGLNPFRIFYRRIFFSFFVWHAALNLFLGRRYFMSIRTHRLHTSLV